MKIQYYHKSFDYQDEYKPKNNQKGILVDAERIVCPTCNGNGHHFRRDLDENAMIDSFREDMDEDGFNAYRNGVFDQKCVECGGNKVVDIPKLPKWAQDCVNDWEEEQAMQERVRKAECGYRY